MRSRLTALLIGAGALTLCAVCVFVPKIRQLEYFVLALLALSAVAAGCAAIAGRGAARNVALAVASTLLTLCGLEAVASITERGPDTLFHYEPNYYVESELGRSPLGPGSYKSHKTDARTNGLIYDVLYTIDHNLLRKTISPSSGSPVAFFGDSFTFGEGVDDWDTLPQAFADLTGRQIRVLNFGFHGYGPEQFLRVVETGMFDRILGDTPRLFVYQTAVWQAERTACQPIWVRASPSYKLKGSEVTLAGRCSERLSNIVRRILSKSAFYRQYLAAFGRGNPSKEEVELYLAVMLKAIEVARERYGAPTLVLYLSYSKEYLSASGMTDDAIKTRLLEHGAHVLDVTLTAPNGTPLFDYSAESPFLIAGDGHPSALAHRTRASVLLKYVEEHLPSVVDHRKGS